MTEFYPDGRVKPYGWSLAWIKRRIAAHRRAAGFETGHRAKFQEAMADRWESQNQTFLERRGDPKIRVLDFYKPPPPEALS